MKNLENTIENKTIEETLNEVKNAIANNNDMTKEQIEKMIKKCDILIKKNKNNLDRYEKQMVLEVKAVNETEDVKLVKEKVAELNYGHYLYEEILETLVIKDERDARCVRYTIECWYGVDLEILDDNVYAQNDPQQHIYFFDDSDEHFIGMAVRFEDDRKAMEDTLDRLYPQEAENRWYDRRLDVRMSIYRSWLIYEFETLKCSDAIREYEEMYL